MKKEKVLFLWEILVTQMNHWILFLLGITVMGMIGVAPPVMWHWALCSMLPFLFFLVRRYTNHFVIFMGSHILAVAVFVLLPNASIVEKIVIIICAAYYLCESFVLRIKSEERLDHVMNPMLAVGLAGLGYLLQHYQGTQDWESYYVLPVVVFLGLYFVQLYLQQYLNFMVVNESSAGHIPEKEMFRSGITLVSLFSIGASAVVLLTANIGWVGQIAQLLKLILTWIIRFLFRGGAEEADDSPIEEQELIPEQDAGFMPIEDAEPALFWVILEKIIMTLVWVGLIAICIWGIYSLVNFLYKRFSRNLEKDEEEEPQSIIDVREKCEVERKKKERRSPFEFLSTKERIRRIYRKEVWAQRMQLVTDGSPSFLKLLTARECGEKMERSALSESYEKARYSNAECTAEDIRRAKEK